MSDVERPAARKANILLVDDEPGNLLALGVILEGLGQNVVEARSGEEALRRLLDDDFAVVLLDVQMRGMDGLEVARRIRGGDRARHTPVIFVTAFESPREAVAHAYSLGAVDYLTKPIVPEILRAKVAVFVDLFHKAERIRELEREQLARTLADAKSRRERAEEKAREHGERLRVTLASIGDAVIATDEHARVTFLNPVAEGLTGWTLAEAAGRARAAADRAAPAAVHAGPRQAHGLPRMPAAAPDASGRDRRRTSRSRAPTTRASRRRVASSR